MKTKNITRLLQVLIMIIMLISTAWAQTPTVYQCSVRNDSLLSSTIYEFDIYLLDNDPSNVFELATFQAGIVVNSAIVNGGTITATIVAGSSQLVTAQQPTGITFATNCIKLAPRSGPGHLSGTVISATAPGTRVARIRLTNTVTFGLAAPNLTFNFTASPYNTIVSAYDQTTGLNTIITNSLNHIVSTMVNPLLNTSVASYSVTGTGSYCTGGVAVGLSGSQTGVLYQLIKNSVPVGSYVPGTGSALAFGNQLAGTYTVSGYRQATYLTGTMTGSAVVSTTSIVPALTGNTSVCTGSTGNVYTTDAGMTNYIWTVSSGGTITAGGTTTSNTVTVTWATAGAQSVSVNYTNAGCTGATATVLPVTVGSITPTITGTNSLCVGTTGVIYTTQSGMTNYIWSVSSGGTITAGGTSTSNTATVTWNTAGAQSVSVNYTNGGCSGSSPTVYPVTVNTLPVPAITGTASLCIGSTGNVYTTQTGMTGYIWTVSSGGTITSGGTSTSNTVTVTWNTAGAQSVSVNYTNSGGCTAASATAYPVTVNALPVPTITGTATLCAGSTGNVYTSQTGMSNYVWTVSSGGTITAGGTSTSNTVAMTWNTAGAQSVSVNYTNTNSCTAASATVYPVTVNTLPVPTITGPTPVCINSTGNVYTTQAAMTNYIWTVSSGGTITAGGTTISNTVTITWNTSGAQTVSVNYTNTNSCTAAIATVYPVTVNALPVPTITGPATVCASSTGNVYTTQTGMSNYTWTVSSGGTITAGGTTTSNTVTVTWNTAGAQSVSVNYTNGGCTAASATVYPVTVNTLPVPTITGTSTVCAGTTGNVYTTQTGMTSYIWTVSSGGTITAGGTSTSNTVTVTWNTAGAQSVSVNYTNANSCTAVSATSYPVTVNAAPVPTIAGPASICVGTAGNVYTTQSGMTNYVWTVTSGGTITAGGTSTSNTVTVTWTTAGAQNVSVNYTNTSSCTATSATFYPVTVNALPVPTISGPAPVCVNSTSNVYTTQSGMSIYVWTVSSGGTITAGGTSTSNTVTVTWNTSGAQSVSVNYANVNGCTASSATVYPVTVNALPVPTITGSAAVCVNSVGNVYTTQTGMINYVWTVSLGGSITAGGTSTSNTVTVTWNTTGAQTVSVSYNNGCTASSPTVYPVTVNTLPSPTITGTASLCAGTTGNVYTTQTGMSNYIWTVSSGGTITSGGTSTSNTVTISWNTAGAQTVSVNYTNANSCTAASPTVYPVNVNAVPVPSITGTASLCAGSSGNVYTTQAGMTNYVWTVSSGGTITAGGTSTSNTVTITWNTAGAQSLSVNYTNSSSCTAATATVYPVTVIALPIPSITGSSAVCINSTGNVYTTQAGMTNYVWTVTSGGTITAGGTSTSNTVTVTWNSAGAQSVSVNYTNSNSCTAATATVYPVSVNALPIPTITGSTPVCVNSSGNIYTTQSGMSNYIWTVSLGGTITAGGTSTSNTVTITWNTAGAQSVSVNYTNANSCTAASATVYPVTVNALPVPTITGTATLCAGTTGNVYTTQTGMSNYVWTVSSGGTITAGGTSTSNAVTITWNTAGAQSVSVNYTNTNSCTAASATVYPVTVNALPVPTITGTASLCVGSSGNIYTTQAGMTNYVWTVSSGGTITAGGTSTSNTVTVTWNTAGAQTVSVNYTNSNSCTAASATIYPVTVNALPVPTITGTASLCAGTTGNIYTTQTGMTNYIWTISSGGTITAGGTSTSNTVTITWNTAGAQSVSVNYTNSNSCTAASATTYPVIVNALPVPTITGTASLCTGATGNVYTTQSGMTNYVWTVSSGGTITSGGTSTNNTVTVTWNTAGAQYVSVNYTNSNSCTAASAIVYPVTVNALPVQIITGTSSLCAGTTGNVYTTQTGMTNYVWTVSSGGTITAGGTSTSNTVTITWNTAGAQTVSVNYTNSSSCTATSAAVYPVTVNALPVPTITGTASLCAGSTGIIYNTQASMANYVWAVSSGGTITAGGTSTSNTVTVTWNNAGAQSVSVNYTNSNSCTAASATIYPVTVISLPVPTITGLTTVCANSTGNIYTTQSGMSNYVWTVSSGGTISAGGTSTSNTVTVTWNTAGAQSVSVNYANGNGCTAASATVYPVTVNALPVPTITGSSPVCLNTTGNVYTTQAGMSNYVWTVSSGGTITAGGTSTSNTVTVTWNTTGAQSVNVNYTNSNNCSATSATVYPVTVNQIPSPTITGISAICAGASGNIYTTQTGMTNYIWTVSSGGTITAGGTSTSSTVTVKWNTAGAQSVSVNYNNLNGCPATNSTTYPVTVYARNIPIITGPTSVCEDSPGETYTTLLGLSNYVWTVSPGQIILAGGTSTSNSIKIKWMTFGAQSIKIVTTNASGCIDSSSLSVFVNPDPVALFTSIDSSECMRGNSFAFVNNSTIPSGSFSNLWRFGDNNTSVQLSPTHTYLVPGTFQVTLVTISNNGCRDSLIKNYYVRPQPVAAFTSIDSVLCLQGNSFSFVSHSSISSGTISSLWRFGDNTTSSTSSLYHTYPAAGNYTAWLIVISNYGCKDSVSKNYIIRPNANTAFTSIDTSECFKGNNFVFTNTTNIGSGTYTNLWKFGDNTTSTLTSPTHSYTNAGNYQVKLVTTSNLGCTDSIIKNYYVRPNPSAVFTSNLASSCFVGNNFKFTNNSTISTGIFIDEWTFGDSTTSNSTSPSHSYLRAGSFNVKLLLTSDYGCRDSQMMTIAVLPEPVVHLGSDITVFDTQKVTLDAGAGFDSYLWSNGKTTQKITIDTTGIGHKTTLFWVKVTKNGCQGSASLLVKFNPLTGIDATSVNMDIKVFPNPTESVLNVQTIGLKGEIHVTLVDMNGKALKTINYMQDDMSLVKQIDISDLTKGIYFMVISNNEKTKQIKVIKY